MFGLLNKKPIKEIDQVEEQLKHYKDSEGLSTHRLNFGLWYFRHRKHFFLTIVGILSVVATVLFIYSLYYFGNYLLRGMTSQQQSVNGLVSDVTLRGTRLDQNSVRPRFVKLISLANGNYDLIGTITNANTDYWLDFNYYFVVDGQPLDVRSGFVLPQEQHYLLSLNQTLPSQPNSVELIIDNWGWHRLDSHQIPDWSAYKEQYLNFVIQDKEFLGYEDSGLTENLKMASLSFNIVNQTPYSYYEAPLNIIIYQNSEVVSVAQYVIDKFASREKRDIEISILSDINEATRIEILPDINIFNEEVIAPLDIVN
ncbi:MAG: hypothetical protein V1765_02985 [bacterium]